MVGTIIQEGFALKPSQSERRLRIALSGCADGEVQPLLADYFKQVHEVVLTSALEEVIVDIHELYFINSSCLKAFVSWIDWIHATTLEHRYRLRFLKDKELRWQTRSFDALYRMSAGLVTVEDWPGGGL